MLPSREDVAIYIELEGVVGIGGTLGLLPAGEAVFTLLPLGVDGAGEPLNSDVILLTASGFAVDNGGGNGDIETAVMEAECA